MVTEWRVAVHLRRNTRRSAFQQPIGFHLIAIRSCITPDRLSAAAQVLYNTEMNALSVREQRSCARVRCLHLHHTRCLWRRRRRFSAALCVHSASSSTKTSIRSPSRNLLLVRLLYSTARRGAASLCLVSASAALHAFTRDWKRAAFTSGGRAQPLQRLLETCPKWSSFTLRPILRSALTAFKY